MNNSKTLLMKRLHEIFSDFSFYSQILSMNNFFCFNNFFYCFDLVIIQIVKKLFEIP